MNDSNKINIRFKLIVLSTISLAGMIIGLMIFIQSIDNNLYKEKQAQTQKSIETGMGIISYFHGLEEKGELNSAEAKKLAKDSLSSFYFGDTGYFWINSTSGVLLMNPNAPHLVGTLMIDTKDVKGKYLLREFIKTAMEGGGWVDYYRPRPGSSKAQRKVSYVALFGPWDWVLGTGLYLDDMEKEIRNTAINGVMTISIIFIVLIWTSVLLSNKFMKQIKDIAIKDPLTTLFTRRFLLESIPMFLSRHDRSTDQYLTVVFFDVDHFKAVNDNYGHSCGDKVLAGIGKTIKDALRKSDLGIRYGGEEFVIFMLCNSQDEAISIAERIRSESHKLVFNCKGKEFSITLSAGVSFRLKGEEFDSMFQRSDENLYKAKNSGRDRLVS